MTARIGWWFLAASLLAAPAWAQHPAGGSPREFREFLQSEIAKWAKVINAAGIEPL